jgi:MFS family permease
VSAAASQQRASAPTPDACPRPCSWGSIGIGSDFVDLYTATSAEYLYNATTTMDDVKMYVWDHLGMPKAFKQNPTKYSTAMNLLNVNAALSGAAGAAFWGVFSDKFGRKPAMLACHVGGLAGYITMYLAGTVVNSYWLYFAGLMLNGLFSGAYVIVMSFFLNLLPKEEQAAPVGLLMMMAMLGAALGTLVLMPFITGRAAQLFDAAYIGIAGTVVSFFLVFFVVTEPRREGMPKLSDLTKGKSKSNVEPPKPVPAFIKRVLITTVIGSMLDAAGDEGTRIARGTLMSNIWPSTNTIMFQNQLLLALVGVLFVTMALMSLLKKLFGIGITIVIGATTTLICQCLFLRNWESYTPWLAIFFTGKAFGFMSTFGSDLVINQVSPEDAKGTWQGRSQATSMIGEGVATLAIALIYDRFNDGSTDGLRGKIALYITIGISSLAVLAYLPLIGILPKEVDEKGDAKRFHTVEEYEAMPDVEASQLPLQEVGFLEEKRMKEKKTPRIFSWGKYVDDVGLIDGMMQRAEKDFQWMKQDTILNLTQPERLKEQMEMYETMQAVTAQRNEQCDRKQMGAWIADYLDDAGYDSWKEYPSIYKTMIINAFPPIDKLDNMKPDLTKVDVEAMMVKFLKVADQHIAQRRAQLDLPSRIGLAKIATKFKRR